MIDILLTNILSCRGIIAEKASDDLFTLDTTGDVEIQREYRKKHKTLKADEILAQRSAVPSIDSRKRPADSRTTNGVLPSKRRREGGVSHKELQRLRHIAYHGNAVEKEIAETGEGADHDPWEVQEEVHEPQFNFLEKQKPVREPKTLKHAPVSLLASGKPAPAVAKPDAGRSYNPLFSDWDNLVSRMGQKEVEAEEKRLQDEAEEEARQARIAASAAEAERESNGESDWESEWEGIQSEPEQASLAQKRPERKTKAERNKIKKRKETERLARHEKKMKEKEAQASRVRALAKELEQKARIKEQALVVVSESESEGEEVLRRRSLGKVAVPGARLDLALSEDLTDSLRKLKPEGNLLQDRFRNILVRGKVETRKVGIQHKKKQVTVTEKWTYKDWTL